MPNPARRGGVRFGCNSSAWSRPRLAEDGVKDFALLEVLQEQDTDSIRNREIISLSGCSPAVIF